MYALLTKEDDPVDEDIELDSPNSFATVLAKLEHRNFVRINDPRCSSAKSSDQNNLDASCLNVRLIQIKC